MNRRDAAVAGMFYPAQPQQLKTTVETLLSNATSTHITAPKALVVPHAGYVYSGQVAANGYVTIKERAAQIKRVILLGPNHRVPLQGMAAPSVDFFSTPLGDIPIDRECISNLVHQGTVHIDDLPHQDEHCLETQLPFLQQLLTHWWLVPLVVGQTPQQQVADLLEQFIDNPHDLIVISSDLSHFHSYAEAQRIDNQTTALIEACQPILNGEQACGCQPLNGLLLLASERHFKAVTLDLKNSGDTAGDKQRVVGYGSYAVV